MTFHAPQSNGRLIAVVARRALCNRATILAAALVSTTVVLAGRGGEQEPHLSGTDVSSIARLSLADPGPIVRLQSASLKVKDVPETLKSPVHKDRKIVSRLYKEGSTLPTTHSPAKPDLDALQDKRLPVVGSRSGGDSPEMPEKMEVRVASLNPSNRDWDAFDVTLSPRLPELGPVPINPSPDLSERDLIPSIRDLEARPEILTLTAESGEMLEQLLTRADLAKDDFRGTLVALRADDIPQSLIEGDMIDLAFLAKDDRQLLAIRLRQLGQPPVELRWDSDTAPLWASLDQPVDVTVDPVDTVPLTQENETISITGKKNGTIFVGAEINSSLYASATKAGLTAGETKAITNIFRYSVDFERDLRQGDRFEALFEKGKNGAYGDILYAKLTNRGSEIALYRGVDDSTGEVGYFDATGKTNKRSLMRTPVAGAQVSSHFGMRHHPVLGYTKMHRGTDFRAQTGTPIFAAGDGIIDYLGRKGAYGKYIRIRHNGVYDTAYAHMSRYASGLATGSRVRQGDVIGYVGSTGRSTGPHLHFEILEHGNQINPLNIADFGPVRGLSGSALSEFMVRVSRIEIALTLLRDKTRVAAAE